MSHLPERPLHLESCIWNPIQDSGFRGNTHFARYMRKSYYTNSYKLQQNFRTPKPYTGLTDYQHSSFVVEPVLEFFQRCTPNRLPVQGSEPVSVLDVMESLGNDSRHVPKPFRQGLKDQFPTFL